MLLAGTEEAGGEPRPEAATLAGQRWLHPRGDPCRAIRASSRASAPAGLQRGGQRYYRRVVALGKVDGFPHSDIPEACPPGEGALVRVINADAADGPMLRRPVSYLVDQLAVLCLLSAAQSTANRGK